MERPLISGQRNVETVLCSPDFAPPPIATSDQGSVIRLRAEMARFSHGTEHVARRAQVDATIAALDGVHVALAAEQLTRQLLTGPHHEALSELGSIVPTWCLATALGVAQADLESTRRAVLKIVQVIGRSQAATQQANDAADQLRAQFGSHAHGAVSAISLLYQNHDATAALFASSLDAWSSLQERRSAISRTSRITVRSTDVLGQSIAADTTVDLDLEGSGLEFGAGPHHCPGQVFAESIVRGLMTAIRQGGYHVLTEQVERDAQGRPTVMPIERDVSR